MLSKLAVEEFQKIYEKEFGIRLSMTEATEQASNLIRLFKSVLSGEDDSIDEKKD